MVIVLNLNRYCLICYFLRPELLLFDLLLSQISTVIVLDISYFIIVPLNFMDFSHQFNISNELVRLITLLHTKSNKDQQSTIFLIRHLHEI
jgi:hypothetical protein